MWSQYKDKEQKGLNGKIKQKVNIFRNSRIQREKNKSDYIITLKGNDYTCRDKTISFK